MLPVVGNPLMEIGWSHLRMSHSLMVGLLWEVLLEGGLENVDGLEEVIIS